MKRLNRHAVSSGENGSFWLSFSDMMSVMVLIFVFVIFAMMYSLEETKEGLTQLQEEYSIALARTEASEQEQQRLIILLADKEQELAQVSQELEATGAQIALLQSENSELQTANDELSQQYLILVQNKSVLEGNIASLSADISALQQQLAAQRSEYAELEKAAAESAALAAGYQSEISAYKTQLEQTQQELEQMLGVKTQIIERLSDELRAKNISVEVDRQTGAISLSGGTLFDVGATALKQDGMAFLDQVLPVYFSVLMSDEFRPYIAEIVIEGHTDSSGKAGEDAFLYNLGLSQQRALAVANYILNPGYMTGTLKLSVSDATELRGFISAAGRSFSSLIYNEDGTENAYASRRVEIKFRLKDDDTINTTKLLLELIQD